MTVPRDAGLRGISYSDSETASGKEKCGIAVPSGNIDDGVAAMKQMYEPHQRLMCLVWSDR